jgi:hypothetical protein
MDTSNRSHICMPCHCQKGNTDWFSTDQAIWSGKVKQMLLAVVICMHILILRVAWQLSDPYSSEMTCWAVCHTAATNSLQPYSGCRAMEPVMSTWRQSYLLVLLLLSCFIPQNLSNKVVYYTNSDEQKEVCTYGRTGFVLLLKKMVLLLWQSYLLLVLWCICSTWSQNGLIKKMRFFLRINGCIFFKNNNIYTHSVLKYKMF